MESTILSLRRACLPVLALLLGGALAAQEHRYAYDAAGRLTQVVYPDCATTFYEYDLRGNLTRIETVGAPVRSYCTAKTNSLGCVPAIGWNGVPSVSSSAPFTISAANVVNHKNGLLFFGTNGPNAAPFQGGTLCVKSPVRRTAIQGSGGTAPPAADCSGTYAYDFNALVQSGVHPELVAGARVHAQYWSRDPASPSTTGLTDGIELLICD
jgi:YD repeat-containing protein